MKRKEKEKKRSRHTKTTGIELKKIKVKESKKQKKHSWIEDPFFFYLQGCYFSQYFNTETHLIWGPLSRPCNTPVTLRKSQTPDSPFLLLSPHLSQLPTPSSISTFLHPTVHSCQFFISRSSNATSTDTIREKKKNLYALSHRL